MSWTNRRQQKATVGPKTRIAKLQWAALAVLKEEGVLVVSLAEWVTNQDLSMRGCYQMSKEPLFYLQQWAAEKGLAMEIEGDVLTLRDPAFKPKVRHPIAVQRSLFEED